MLVFILHEYRCQSTVGEQQQLPTCTLHTLLNLASFPDLMPFSLKLQHVLQAITEGLEDSEKHVYSRSHVAYTDQI